MKKLSPEKVKEGRRLIAKLAASVERNQKKDFKTLVVSKYKIVSKDELTIPTADLAKGKWFKGQHKREGFGIYPIPRVKYLGKKNGLYEFMKEDGHPVKVSEEEMESERYAFFEDQDQSENLTGYTSPNYSDSSHLDRMAWVKRPFETWTLDCKKDSNWMQGSHIAFTLKTASGEDKIHDLMGFQRSCNNLKYLGDKATEAAEQLWKYKGVKIKLGKNLLAMLPLNVESNFKQKVEAKYKIVNE